MMNLSIAVTFVIGALTLSTDLTNTPTNVHKPPSFVPPPRNQTTPLPVLPPTAPVLAPVPLRLKLALTDGTLVIGVPFVKSLPVKTTYAEVQIPLEHIRSATFSKDHAEILALLANGDRVTAAPKLAEFKLDTLFGKISVETRHITAITVLPGNDAKDASGNGQPGK